MTTRDRPLRYLFLDLNAYFASCEQEERPELRGRPVAVVPVMADTSFCIAASYEAKRYGVKTGTMIRHAREKCPDITFVKARSQIYVRYHKAVLEAAESVLPIEQVCSIDEMRFRLLDTENSPGAARELALRMKKAIREKVGERLTCSIGIAPNPFLAKVASDMQKPDGLVILQADDLPHRLHELDLTDFAGINRKMAARLNGAGIFTAEQMCAASRRDLHQAFGSVIGERWWYLLRGFLLGDEHHDQKSLGHSHVLPPDLRTDEGCREVILRLLTKAAARLRATQLWAAGMDVYVRGYRKSWNAKIKLPPTQDSVTLTEAFHRVWQDRDFEAPRTVGVTFYELRTAEEFTPSLFDPTEDRAKLSHAVDAVNRKFGKNSVFIAGMDKVKHTAEEKIAFNKTWLFNEGKPEDDWMDTFRGLRDVT